jgi:membrane protein YqaA with SNARE-associated domain
MPHLIEYLGLFTASVLSATVFPFQSEVVLFGMLLSEHYKWLLLVLVASAGNTLGSVINWFLGRFIAHFEDRRWFPVKRQKMVRAERWYHQYGQWSLLLSWVPIIGDPLTIVAGVLREPLPVFVLLVGVAKTARYFAVVALTFGWM